MELPKGISTVQTQTCPVVKEYNRRFKQRTLNRPKPETLSVKFDPSIDIKKLEKFWVLSAIQHCNGSLYKAAKLIGMSRETLYRKVREYNSETK